MRSLKVRANLVVPVLIPKGLWGLLIAHHSRSPRLWKEADIAAMKKGATALAETSCIRQD